jgi:hypothetical protein
VRLAVIVMLALLACGCGTRAPEHLVVRVRGSSTSAPSTTSCFLLIRTPIVGGGTQSYCLETYTGHPGPSQTLHDAGVMTFVLPDRTIRADVRIVAKFAPDGFHAVQRLRGRVVGGGTIVGGGPYVEKPAGHVASSNLRYTVTLP